MELTDKEALWLLKRANSPDLTDHVLSYPEDEREGLSDVDIVIDEIQYLIELYEDTGNVYGDGLADAKVVMSETKNGKSYGPVFLPSFEFKYTKKDIENAKTIVDEYKRLKKIIKEYYS